MKTTFSPSTAAAKSFSRNPILAIREGFKRNLATATVVPFADFYFFQSKVCSCFLCAVWRQSAYLCGKVEGVVVVPRSVTKRVQMRVVLPWALQRALLRAWDGPARVSWVFVGNLSSPLQGFDTL